MTIRREHFEEGRLLSPEEVKMFGTKMRQVLASSAQSSILSPGEYDVSPGGGRALFEYNLVVHDDGTGTLRLLQKGKPVQRISKALFGLRAEKGGQVIRIPQDSDAAVIATPTSADRVRLYEIISYEPDTHGDFREPRVKLAEDTQSDEERIKQPVRTIQEAEEMILESAYEQVRQLDWQKLGVQISEFEEVFEPMTMLVLRNSGHNFPFNILDESRKDEGQIISSLEADHKRRLIENYWLVLVNPELTSDEATFIRDWVMTTLSEMIAVAAGKSEVEGMLWAMDHPTFLRAAKRVFNQLSELEE